MIPLQLNRDTLNPLLNPPLSNKPPPPFQRKKIIKPPLSFKPPPLPSPFFFTAKLIPNHRLYHDRNTSCGVIRYGLLVNNNVDNNLCNTFNITQISTVDRHCSGPKQEVGNRNSSLFLLFFSFFLLPLMRFAKLNKPPLSNKPPLKDA